MKTALVAGIAPQPAGGGHGDGVGSEVLGEPHLSEVGSALYERFAREEAHGQLLVLAWRAHRDRQRASIHANLKRLLDRHLVA